MKTNEEWLTLFKHYDTGYNTFISAVYKNNNGLKKQRNILYKYVSEDGKDYAEDLVNGIKVPFGFTRTDDKDFVMINAGNCIDNEIEMLLSSGEELTPNNILKSIKEKFDNERELSIILTDEPTNFDIKEKKMYSDSEQEKINKII